MREVRTRYVSFEWLADQTGFWFEARTRPPWVWAAKALPAARRRGWNSARGSPALSVLLLRDGRLVSAAVASCVRRSISEGVPGGAWLLVAGELAVDLSNPVYARRVGHSLTVALTSLDCRLPCPGLPWLGLTMSRRCIGC